MLKIDTLAKQCDLFFDVMDLTLKENVPGLLIFIEFQKAFDSLEWNFLLSCLEAFNFGPDFI